MIGITMGCPAGIGPEIILKHFQQAAADESFRRSVVIGDPGVLQSTAELLGINLRCVVWKPGDGIEAGTVPIFPSSSLAPDSWNWGAPNAQTGRAMAQAIETGVQLVEKGTIAGIATCPISKMALQQAGYSHPGHTEMLAELTGSTRFAMMMAGTKMRITLVTIHCSYKEVLTLLDSDAVLERLELTHEALQKDFALASPRIAVAALNPHAGEQGIFGSEEREVIEPAIDIARKRGIDALGPMPADTVFIKAAAGFYDGVLCMYHDQGLIPFKLLHFEDGVNVTIGLPIVRTSVDHGTAYDIAGRGVAGAASLTAAVQLAAEIASNRTPGAAPPQPGR